MIIRPSGGSSSPPQVPIAPANLVVTSTQTTAIGIGWSDLSANEAGFRIERCTGTGCSGFTQIAETAENATSYTDSNLAMATTYRYRVRSFNSQGNSATYTTPVEVTTLGPTAVVTLNDISSLQDEKDAYGIFGWTYTGGQVPTIANGPYSVTGPIDVHASLEADDLWQNIVMYQRTGTQGYSDLRDAWLTYYLSTYLTDYASDLSGFFGDHTFGWGLIETGTSPSLAAANAIADTLQAQWYGFSTTTKNGFNGMRGPGRILKLASDITASGASNRRQWADDIWAALRDSFNWHELTVNGTDTGYWHELDAQSAIFEPGGQFEWAAGSTGMISSFSAGVLNEGLAAYYDLTGNAEVRRRLILMARFAQQFMLDSASQHTGAWVMVNAFGNTGTFYHSSLGSGQALQPFYTCTSVNTLVRGYLLTGDVGLLNRARLHWDRSSKATAGDTFPYTDRAPDDEVGHFMNKNMTGTIYYESDGELTYVSLLFKAVVNLNPALATPLEPDALTATTVSSTQINLSWNDRSNNELGFKIEQAVGAGAFSQVATVGANVTTYSDPGLTPSQLYRYKVRAYNNNGDSSYTTIAQDTTSSGGSPTAPSDPTGLTVTAVSYSQINLTWTDTSNNESGFEIQRAIGVGGFSLLATTGPNIQAYPDTGLTANTLYSYKVRAINVTGQSSYTSTESDTTPSTSDLWSVMTNSSLRDSLTASSWIVIPGPDGKSDNIGNVLISWSGGIILERPNNEQWLIIKNGGHDSWMYNDVWGYRLDSPSGWTLLRKSYLPYVNRDEWDGNVTVGMDPSTVGTTNQLGTSNAHSIFADGSPGNAHTYDMCGYSDLTDECWWYSGAHTNGGPRQAPINKFSMATYTYSYGPNWFSSVLPGTQFAVTDTKSDGTIVISGYKMMNYNPQTNVVTDLATTTAAYEFYQTGRYVNGKMYSFGPSPSRDPGFTHTSCRVHEPGVQGETFINITPPIPFGTTAPGVAWEPDISQFVIWIGQNDVYLLDPVTGISTPRTVPGTNPGEAVHFPGDFSLGVYKRFGRIGSGQYVLMNSLDAVHLLTLDLTPPAASTINFNNATNLGENDGASTTLTGSHSCSGSDRLGVVAILGDNNNGGAGADDIASVTWGGSPCTLIDKITVFPDNSARFQYLYAILGPATGSQSIVITTSGAHSLYGLAASYTGVQQSSQPDATTTHISPSPTSSTLTTSLTTTTDESWIIMVEQSFKDTENTPGVAGAGAVRRTYNATYGNISIFDSGGAISPTGSYSMTTTRPTSPVIRGINHIMASFKPA